MLDLVARKLKRYKVFEDILSPKAFEQFKRYLITGFTSFAIEYGIFTLLNQIVIPDKYLAANSIALFIVFWYNFLMNRFWSFKSDMGFWKQLRMYGALFVFNIFATNILLYIFSGIFGIWPYIAKVIVMGFVVCWNFILYKKLIYK